LLIACLKKAVDGVSYRDLEEIMEERGVNVDHATLNRWVIRYAPAIAAKAHAKAINCL
jgi:putative transposase